MTQLMQQDAKDDPMIPLRDQAPCLSRQVECYPSSAPMILSRDSYGAVLEPCTAYKAVAPATAPLLSRLRMWSFAAHAWGMIIC
jgi:hypothetical protein